MNQLTRKHTIFLLLMLLLTARFMVAGWNRILLNSNSADGDQGAYLQLGLDVREQGHLTDGKRNPLYPVVLSTFARREWSYFTWAKIVNLAVGLVTLWSVYLVGRRLFHPAAGLLAAFLLSINIEFIMHSTFALAESLLVLTFLLAWFAMVRALQQPGRIRYWLAAGALAGLAYLAKGTGPLIALGFAATATLLYGPRVWLKRGLWSFIIGFALAALPLWLYNWLTFGSPVFNSAISNVMWMDSATEKYVADPATLPTLSSYFKDKSPAEAWERLWQGLVSMRYFFARLLWPTRSLTFDRFFQAGGVDLALALAVAALLAARRSLLPVAKTYRAALLLTGVLVAGFYLLFGWYLAISPFPIRFILPLAPMLFLLISAGLVGLAGKMVLAGDRLSFRAGLGIRLVVWAVLALPVGWAVVTGWLLARGSMQNAFAADAAFNTAIDQPLQWVETGHPADRPVTVMWGPTHMLPVWRHSHRLNLVRTPVAQAGSVEELEAFMDAGQVAYVVVDGEMVERLGRDNAAAWGIERLNDGRLQVNRFPDDWALGFAGPELPCRWCVFRRLTAPPAFERTEFVLDNSIVLFGYNVESGRFYPGGQVVVTLFWASAQPVAADYTVFTQLLGPDYRLHGQLDRRPLEGHWPTSRWQSPQKFVDKFVIPVDGDAPPGDYVLLVGLYNGATGERLPVTLSGQPVADNAIPLHRLTLESGADKR